MRYISSNFSFAFCDESTGCISFNPMSPSEAWEWVKEDTVANVVKPQHRVSASLAAWATGNKAKKDRTVRLFESDELLIMYPPQQNQRAEWDSCRFVLIYIEDSGPWIEEDEE
tara:strand:+ start:182 stop:520 length:339 start_codon:yes stop_codon:yes gene_type:complete